MSILIPAFNAEEFISKTLQSVVELKWPKIEVVIVNDGSTDGTGGVIQDFIAQRQLDWNLIHQQNSGEVNAVNRAFDVAQGEFVSVVNSDDLVHPNLLRELVPVLERDPKLALVYSDWNIVDSEGSVIHEIRTPSDGPKNMFEEWKSFVGPGAVIRTESVARGFLRSQDYPLTSDFECVLYLQITGQTKRVPKILSSWRDHSGGTTARAQSSAWADENLRLAMKTASQLGQLRNHNYKTRRLLGSAHLRSASRGAGDPSIKVVRHVLRALWLYPGLLKRLQERRREYWATLTSIRVTRQAQKEKRPSDGPKVGA